MSATVSWSGSLLGRHPVPDSACLSCHVAPAHHAQQVQFTPQCGSCHIEHQGSMRLAATAQNTCTQCHASLAARGGGALNVAGGIHSFTKGHPDFRALRTASEGDRAAAFGLKFNHAAHLGSSLRAPNGNSVQLQCGDCHRTAAGTTEGKWRFANAAPAMQPASLSVGHTTTNINNNVAADLALHPADGRARMNPAAYQQTCSACHSLEFDEHIQAAAPHADVSAVRSFVVEQLTTFASQHPDVVQREMRSWQQTGVLPQQMPGPVPRTPREWIAARAARSETLLWRGKCNLCHTVTAEAETQQTAMQGELPHIAPSHQPLRFFTSAVFSHGAHQAVRCEECHARAVTSTSGKDLLMPAAAVCQGCHDGQSRPQGPALADGHAESGCSLCHTYHGWTDPQTNATPPHPGFALSELLPHH